MSDQIQHDPAQIIRVLWYQGVEIGIGADEADDRLLARSSFDQDIGRHAWLIRKHRDLLLAHLQQQREIDNHMARQEPMARDPSDDAMHRNTSMEGAQNAA